MWAALAAASRRARVVARAPGCGVAPHVVQPGNAAPAVAAGGAGAPVLLYHGPGASRGFYFPRKNWYPWRTKMIHHRQAALRKKRHIWPRRHDPEEAPIFGDREEGVVFREKDLRLGMKRLLDYARVIKGKQLQDAIDWVESLARMKSQPILKMLRKMVEDCKEFHNMDPARIYIMAVQPQRGTVIKTLRKHARSNFGIMESPRNMFMIRVRQMPLEEYFHRLYIFNKVPRSVCSDMRVALHQSRVSEQMQKEWSPYLCATSRLFHRKTLKWLDSTRQFNYYEARREWIQNYKANQLRASIEAREARGLPPMPLLE